MRHFSVPILVLFFLAADRGAVASPDRERYLETFQVVWETIRDTYYDPDFNGVDWEASYASHLPAVEAADDMRTLRLILRDMLADLGQSHFAIISGSPELLKAGEGRGPGVLGLEVAADDARVLVTRVREDSPAAEAGIRPGFQLLEIGDRAVDQLAADAALLPVPDSLRAFTFHRYLENSMTGPVGETIELRLLGQPGSISRTFELRFAPDRRARTGSYANMPPIPMELHSDVLSGNIHYLAFSTFSLELMERIRSAIQAAATNDAAGLILDLRGNTGGVGYMAAGITGLLADREITLGTMQMRSGHFSFIGYPQPGAYLGPVAVLVDRGSASTSEILAAGLQEAGRARVFGAPTAGAVLPSMFKELPNGDTLQCVVADFKTAAGTFLEGKGVAPDQAVPLKRAPLLAGKDPIRDAAIQWIRNR